MPKILIIDDDKIMAECFASMLQSDSHYDINLCTNVPEAMNILDSSFPDLIILDILLDGYDGFSFLNELMSYSDTAKIPVIIVSSLNLQSRNLSHYGVVSILQKETMTPVQLLSSVEEALRNAE